MPNLNFIVICDKAEQSNNKLNLEGVFDTIYSSGFPAVHKSMVIVVNFDIEKEQLKTEFFIIRKDNGKIILTSDKFPVTGSGLRKKQQFIHRIEGLNLPESGKYVVEIYVDDKKIGSNYFLATSTTTISHA